MLCTLSVNLVCLMFPHEYIQVIHFWQEYHRKDVLPSVHDTKRCMILICLITNDVNFDPMGKLPGLSILKVLFFPIIVN